MMGDDLFAYEDAYAVGSSDAAQGSSSSLTADEVASIIDERVSALLAGTEGNILTNLGARISEGDGRVIGTLGANLNDTETRIVSNVSDAVMASTSGTQVGSLSMEQVLAYVPEGGPTFATSFLTPLLWGIGAGLVLFIIGNLWESFLALMGLAGDK